MKDDTLYIIDSYGLIYRAYFAFAGRALTNKAGENISAVFGFFRNLKALIDRYDPHYIAAAFDSAVPTFRHRQYPEYKATRQKAPEDLHAQVPVVEEILTAAGIPVIRCDGFEADDVIATLAAACIRKGRRCRILSGDKDLMQLVNDTTEILKPDRAGGWEVINSGGVRQEWGVPPEKMLDLLSLMGDSADNVPGVAGIGEKTAAKLIAEYGSLDEIYAHANEIKGAAGNKVRAGKESAYFSRSLIALREDVPVDTEIVSFSERADFAAAADILYRHGLLSVAKQFDPKSGGQQSRQPEEASAKPPVSGLDPDTDAVPVPNNGVYKAVTALPELEAYIDGVLASQAKQTAFDCETTSLNSLDTQLVGFSMSNKKGTGIYIPLFVSELFEVQETISLHDALRQLERIFCSESCTVIMHNGKFDYEVLVSHGLKEPSCRIADTMIASWLIEPDRSSYGLEQLALSKLGLQTVSFSSIVAKGKTFADVPLQQAVFYAGEDADITWQLWQRFEPKLKENGLLQLFTELEMPVLPLLARMEAAGIRIEKEELNAYGKELKQKITIAEEEIYRMVGHPFNIASTKQLQQVLFAELHLPAGKKTKTGYSTDTAVLEELRHLHPVPAKILEFRMRSKLLSTYVDALPGLADKKDRIHTSFIQTGTATGRLSSREPNLQNIPIRDEEGRKIRQAFTAEEGKLLISADYSQIELVLLAHLSEDEALCKAFATGTDVHRSTASLIFGVPPEEVQPDMRRTAKVINFGVMYGMSAFRLSNELAIPRAQAADFIRQYFTTYAGVRAFIDQTIRHAEQNGFVETIFGRRRYIRNINSRNKTEKSGAERIAVNTPIQGSAADIVKKAMLAVDKMLRQSYPKARLLLQVHDELIIECPEAETESAVRSVKECMEQIAALKVPLKVSAEYGKRWGEFH